jgi:transposase
MAANGAMRRNHARYRSVPARTRPGAAVDGGGRQVRLDIEIDFKTGGRFPCPKCGKADCPVHDTVKKTLRHLDFFQHQAFLHARVARIDCPDCAPRRRALGRPGSGFTLLFGDHREDQIRPELDRLRDFAAGCKFLNRRVGRRRLPYCALTRTAHRAIANYDKRRPLPRMLMGTVRSI